MLTNAICFSNLTFRSDHTHFNLKGNQAGSCTRKPTAFGPVAVAQACVTCGHTIKQSLHICVMYVQGHLLLPVNCFIQFNLDTIKVNELYLWSGPKQTLLTPTFATASTTCKNILKM